MKYTFEILGTLPTFNEAERIKRANRYAANNHKGQTEARIMGYALDAPTFKDHVWVYFEWIRPNARNDKDNVSFAKKYILDALQKCGVITGDGWNKVTPYDIRYAVDKRNPRTIVTITDEEPPMFAHLIS